jgi:hypothetical protein
MIFEQKSPRLFRASRRCRCSSRFANSRSCGQPLKKIEDALERDYFLTGEMAMEWGIVDKVINKRPEDPAALKVAQHRFPAPIPLSSL